MDKDWDEEIIRRFAESLQVNFEVDPEIKRYWKIDHGVGIGAPDCSEVSSGKWEVDLTTTIPGCRTLPNGDPGWPDDASTDTLGQFSSLREALLFAGGIILTMIVDMHEENIQFDKMMTDEAEHASEVGC